MSQNFKNICFTLSERHQLSQAFQHLGGMFPPVLNAANLMEYDAEIFSDKIQKAINSLGFNAKSLTTTYQIKYKGTSYKKDLSVITEVFNDNLIFGQIILAVIHEGKDVYMLVKKFK